MKVSGEHEFGERVENEDAGYLPGSGFSGCNGLTPGFHEKIDTSEIGYVGVKCWNNLTYRFFATCLI